MGGKPHQRRLKLFSVRLVDGIWTINNLKPFVHGGGTLGSGRLVCYTKSSFHSQMDPKLFNLLLKMLSYSSSKNVSKIYVLYFRDFLSNALTLSIFELDNFSFFFRQVRISLEIDWYHFQSANAAPHSAASEEDRPILTKCHIRAHFGVWG